MKYVRGKYSEEELKILRNGYNNPNITVIEIGKRLNRNPDLLYIKAGKMGLSKRMANHAEDGGYQCSRCGEKLIRNKNWSEAMQKRPTYLCKKCVRTYTRNKHREKREKVIAKLGGKCVKCGYKGYALQIDHIKGGGGKERKELGGLDKFYTYLLTLSDEEIKEKYQLLCANHNWEKRQDEIMGRGITIYPPSKSNQPQTKKAVSLNSHAPNNLRSNMDTSSKTKLLKDFLNYAAFNWSLQLCNTKYLQVGRIPASDEEINALIKDFLETMINNGE